MAMVREAEILGVVLNLTYTWCYLNGTLPLGYAFAGFGALALGWACWRRNLHAETILHGFYFLMAGYGAWLVEQDAWSMSQGSMRVHLLAVICGAAGWGLMVPWLKKRGSSLPVVDAFTTVYSLIGTWWMIQGDPINWIYWIVIDVVSVFLYAKRGMPWGALLFAVYTLLALDGWFEDISWFTVSG